MEITATHFRCNEVHCLQIPPLNKSKGHAAAEWGTDIKWTGSMRITSVGEKCHIYLESDGKLFGKSDITKPGAVEPCIDSSRYYVVVLTDDRSGRSVPIGVMFPKEQKSAAFDFKVAVQRCANGGASNINQEVPELHRSLADLGLSNTPGGKISINLKGHDHNEPKRSSAPLPAPPGSSMLSAPPKASSHRTVHGKQTGPASPPHAAPTPSYSSPATNNDPFADFGNFGNFDTTSPKVAAKSADPFGETPCLQIYFQKQ
jgi:hypothetical protein